MAPNSANRNSVLLLKIGNIFCSTPERHAEEREKDDSNQIDL
jgi:hypothetical protein